MRHLRALVAVASAQSVRRAATTAHLSQPALSRQIAQLEDYVGEHLFHRESHGMRLTAAGRATLVQAHRILADVAGLPAVGAPPRTVRLGFMCSLGSVITAAAVRAHRSARPHTHVEVHEVAGPDMVTALLTGQLDMAVSRPLDDSATVAVERIVTEPVAVTLPVDDPLAGSPEVDLANLAERTWVVMAPATSRRRHEVFVHLCAQAGFVPTIGHTSASLSANIATAAAGGGVFPCPASTPLPGGSGLTLVPVSGWTTGIDVLTAPGQVSTGTADLVATVRSVAVGSTDATPVHA